MMKYKKIKVGKKYVDTLDLGLGSKKLIVLKGRKGYIMCGYLDLAVAEKFKDAAVRIVGVSSVRDALRSSVFSCTSCAKQMGIYKGQPVKEALRIIA